MTLACQRCGKRLSRKTARQIAGEIMCSACMFGPSPLERAKASHRPMRDIDEILGLEREPASVGRHPKGQDAQRLGAEHEHAVPAKQGDAQPSSPSSENPT